MSTTKDRSGKKWGGMEDGTEVKGIGDERMVRIIGARHEKLPKTKAAAGEEERTAGRETPDEVGISFANQNSCRQVRRREEFDEAFNTLSSRREEHLSLSFVALLSSTYVPLCSPTWLSLQVNAVNLRS